MESNKDGAKPYLKPGVWIIALDSDSRRYTPSLTKRREVKMYTSGKFYEEYDDCLAECTKMNISLNKLIK